MSIFNPLFLFNILAGLGEYKLRDLNDEINKQLREKYRWEDRIKQLGGPDFKVGYIYDANIIHQSTTVIRAHLYNRYFNHPYMKTFTIMENTYIKNTNFVYHIK